MTVAELIAELQKAPQDATVTIQDNDDWGGWRDVERAELDLKEITVQLS